ncbi:class I SAM-dependent methyltransferase [Alteribacter aurantiacus]|uniref:class I SAM-dependent methyltransferase n=1 Tax=Alteribacter aurantiacus TaxID=254410 RepID=UPI000413F13C|nr:class I SAM-dependent methyltransferase [Alteribacter aurantiacus]
MRKFSSGEFDERVDFFDRMAQTTWLSGLHEELVKRTGSWENKHVLDVGCGTGRLLMRCQSGTSIVTGVDLSSRMISKSQKLFEGLGRGHNATFLTADAEALPFNEDEFDLTISACVLFLMPDPKKVLKEIARVTKGRIALLNPSYENSLKRANDYCTQYNLSGVEQEFLLQWGKVAEHRHRFQEDELSRIMTACGWRDVHHERHLDGLALITTGVNA